MNYSLMGNPEKFINSLLTVLYIYNGGIKHFGTNYM